MSEMEVPVDYINGEPVLAKVVTGAETLRGTHRGSIVLRSGGELLIAGSHQGSLHLESGSSATIQGSHQGSLHVAPGGEVSVTGSQQGSVHIAADGRLEVGSSGIVAGSLHNDGHIINSGRRGGTVSGQGELQDLPGSAVQQPVVRNGVSHYDM